MLNNLINIKVPKQKNINFPKGIFYKPEKKIVLKENLIYKYNQPYKEKNFKININKSLIQKFLISLKKKLKSVKLIKLKFVQNIRTKSEIDP